MLILLHLVLLLLLHLTSGQSDRAQFSCIDTSGQVSQCPGNVRPAAFSSNLVAYAKFANRVNATGWAELELESNGQLEDPTQAYYSGYLEGFITARLIRSSRHNVLEENKNLWCRNLSGLIGENLNFTREMIHRFHADPYWQQVSLALYQLAGLDDGYALATNGTNTEAKPPRPHLNLNPCGIILLNLLTELGDLQSILNQTLIEGKMSHCSALIKLLPNELLVAHNSWTHYTWMLRILKRYTLNYSSSEAKSIAMSSYPGLIFSLDDYYLTSQHLVILETSIPNYNDSLWSTVNPNAIVFEFIRNTVANRLAKSGWEWVKYFSQFNSGTYNNQFMVVDYKRLKSKHGLLTVLEQLPSLIMARDKTDHLRRHSYWSSYNVPYFKSIYELSDLPRMYKLYGDFYSYNKTARALLFARDQSKATNVTSLYHLMRYNDMYHDPLSRCNCTPPYTGEYAIAARCDLNDPTGSYPTKGLSFRPTGAIDAKVTSMRLAKELQMVAVSGPTDENVPAFSWARTKLTDQPHLDQPIEWKFRPVKTEWGRDDVFQDFNFDL